MEKYIGLHGSVYITTSELEEVKQEAQRLLIAKMAGISKPNILEMIALDLLKQNGPYEI